MRGGMSVDCVFCKIIAGEIPADKVYEDEDFLVIRDIKPVAPVHLLVLYKKHVGKIHQLTEEDRKKLSRVFEVIAKVAEKEGILESGYRVVVNNGPDAGQEIDHIHFHVIGGKKLGRIA